MNTEQERKHLAQADRHIAELKKDIARQWQIIEELSLGGPPICRPADNSLCVLVVAFVHPNERQHRQHYGKRNCEYDDYVGEFTHRITTKY
jgi:hypothetical protein